MINKIKVRLYGHINRIDIALKLRRYLKLNQEFFLNGRYYFLMSLKPVAGLNSSNTNKHLSRNINNPRKNIWKFLDVEVKSSKQKKYNGELLMIDRNGSVKIFDFENNFTYTIIKYLEEYKEIYKVNKEMKDIYNLTFTDFNDINKTITENYIDFIDRKNWKKEHFNLAIEEVGKGIKKTLINTYSKNPQSIKNLITDFREKNIDTEYGELVIGLLPDELEDESFSVIRSHGDMNFNNLLLKDYIFYVIDWSESRDTVFFYDFFHIIFADWKWFQNPYFIKNYLDGEYDNLLSDVFLYSNHPYDKNKKKLYLSIFLMNRFLMFNNSSIHKLNDSTKSMTIRALKNIKTFDNY